MNLRCARLVLALAFAATPVAAFAATPPPTVTPKVNPLASQQQQVHDAQVALETAKKQVAIIRKRVEATFVTKPEWIAAKQAMDKAKGEYDAAQRRVAAALVNNPDYKAQLARRDKAQATLDQATNPKPTPSGEDPVKISDEDITTASKDRTEAGLAILSMQKNMGENDPGYLESKQKYLDAKATFDALQVQVDDTLKLDPEYAPAQQAVDQADASLKQARDALATATKAQQDANRKAPPPSTPRTSSYGKHGSGD